MTLGHWPMGKLAAVTITLALLAGTALAQEGGAVRGAVSTVGPDGQSVFLPGAQVALRCAQAPGNDRTAATDVTGRFSFPGLTSAQCTLTVSMQGFRTEAKDVEVSGTPVEVSVELRLMTVEEKITVSEEAPMVETTESSATGQVQRSTLEHAPLDTERFTDALPLLPGVVRGPDGLINVKGARAGQSGLLVNSANVTDPVTGEYGINLPIDVVQSVQVLANPYDAEYGKFTSAVTSLQTRSGGESFKLTFQNFFPRLRSRAGSIVGVGGFSPRLTVSGPIRRGKAYFLQSLEYRFVRTRVPGLEHLDEELRSDTTLESFDSHTQVDLELNPFNHLLVSFSLFPQKQGFVNLNTFNPQEVTPNFRQRGFFLAVQERKIFSDQSFLESSFGLKDFDADVFPADASFPFLALRPEENAGSFFNRQDRESRRYEWQELYHVRPVRWLGQHLLRVGGNVSHSNFRGIHASNPVRIERSDSTLAELTEFVGPAGVARTSTEFSWFLQDKWNPIQRLTLDLGLRYDRDTVGDNNNFAPRAGFALAFTRDNRTVLRGGVGLFYDKIPLNVGAFPQFQTRRVTRFAADGVTPLGPTLQFSNLLAGNHFENPRSTAWNVELDREVVRALVVRVGYQERHSRRDFVVDPVETPTPVLLLSNSGRSRYREFEVTARYQFQEKSQFVVSYVRSRTTGDLNSFNTFFGNFEDPVIRPNQRSFLPFDAPNRFLTWADFSLPQDIIVSPVLEVRDGFPFSLIDANRDFVGARNRAGRFPTFASLDLQVTKAFRLPIVGRVRAGVRIFNLTDHFNPRDLQNNVDSSAVAFREECAAFGQFCNSVGRSFRGKLTIEF